MRYYATAPVLKVLPGPYILFEPNITVEKLIFIGYNYFSLFYRHTTPFRGIYDDKNP